MSTSKHIDKICIIVVSISLVLTILFMNGASLGIAYADKVMGYETRLFDADRVHTVDIVMNNWDSFIENCEDEEYAICTVVIDGEQYKNVGIRAKGNTSLSSVRSMGSERYSFKIEFDQYEDGKSYYGLDKLCLNNLIQDNTMMKDYIAYQLMGEFGVDAPLCSYTYITVNGEDWGLYLAVEGVEDGFLERNYGSNAGELYKPDSMSFGGGRGNGKGFNMEDFDFENLDLDNLNDMQKDKSDSQNPSRGTQQNPDSGTQQMPGGFDWNGSMPDMGNMQQPGGFNGNGSMPDMGNMQQPGGSNQNGNMPDMSGMQQPGGFNWGGSMPDMSNIPGMEDFDFDGKGFDIGSQFGFDIGSGFGGMGSSDVKLQYIDDDPDSYPNIFDNAKTLATEGDKNRLVSSLKDLNEYTNLENVIDMDEVMRYFVVHNFLCNGDSYTGQMVHNYYLYEQDGKLSMIPWDYNLAFGTFSGGDATSSVNADIDNPVSMGSVDDRPMFGWILSDSTYTDEYHQLFEEFVEEWYESGKLDKMIDDTAAMISSYVEKDPTKFCTYEEFEKGVVAIKEFVDLRFESISNQLQGVDVTVDAAALNLSDMGTMGGSMGRGKEQPFQR